MPNISDGPNIFFFDLPVYRLEPERYYKEREHHVERRLKSEFLVTDIDRKFYQDNPGKLISLKDRLILHYGGAWDFNEIIGYVKLHFLGYQIRGEYVGVKVRRYVRTRSKLYEWQTWKLAPEISIESDASNSEIFGTILEYIDACKQELPNRYFDVGLLETIGPHMNWRDLINSRI
jgi:hypothetical protein